MRKKFKRISCLLLVMLCVAGFSIPAFAFADADSTETDAEIEYSYVVDEDGSITITVGGATTEETVIIGTVVTEGDRLNLRTGAGMDYEIIDQLRPGEEVTVIGTEGDWYEVIVPEKHGYVHSDYLELSQKAQTTDDIDPALLQLITDLLSEKINDTTPETDPETKTEPTESCAALTPDGNLTLVDDVLQTEDTGAGQQDKQFITLQSKNGNYFYLVIDRSGDTENVYFLNPIDEADLMALINGDTVVVPTCSCTDKCVVGSINTNCEVCRSNMSECCGTEKVVELEPTEPVTEEPDEDTSSINFLPVIILIIAGGAGGAVYWFKFKKDKANAELKKVRDELRDLAVHTANYEELRDLEEREKRKETEHGRD